MRFHLRQTVPSTSRNSLIDNHFHSTPPITSAKLHDSPNPCKQPAGQTKDHDAGEAYVWRRWRSYLAQVVPILGAGVILGGGLAPQNGVLCIVVAQVSNLFPYLRHKHKTPAPQT